MNDINFKGGFLIKGPIKDELWNEIKLGLPKRKCLFEKFQEEADKFVAVRSVYDREVASLIVRNGVKFKFYPEINLKTRLDYREPEKAFEVVNSQTNFIENQDELREFIRKTVPKRPCMVKRYYWEPNDHIDKTYNALGLKQSDYKTEIKNGITYIKDSKGNIVAKASPNNADGVNFVYVCPTILEGSKRFALTQGGEKFYFGPLKVIDFQKNFLKNVSIDLHRKRPGTKSEKI